MRMPVTRLTSVMNATLRLTTSLWESCGRRRHNYLALDFRCSLGVLFLWSDEIRRREILVDSFPKLKCSKRREEKDGTLGVGKNWRHILEKAKHILTDEMDFYGGEGCSTISLDAEDAIVRSETSPRMPGWIYPKESRVVGQSWTNTVEWSRDKLSLLWNRLIKCEMWLRFDYGVRQQCLIPELRTISYSLALRPGRSSCTTLHFLARAFCRWSAQIAWFDGRSHCG